MHNNGVVHTTLDWEKHQVEFNTMTVVNRLNAREPLEVYHFLRDELGARHRDENKILYR